MDVFEAIDDLAIDDEHEILNYLYPSERKTRTLRERPDNLNTWDDSEFWRRFRLKKDTIAYLLSLIEDKIKHETERYVVFSHFIR